MEKPARPLLCSAGGVRTRTESPIFSVLGDDLWGSHWRPDHFFSSPRTWLVQLQLEGHFNSQQYQVPRSGALVFPTALGIHVTPCPPWQGSTALQGWQGDSSLICLFILPSTTETREGFDVPGQGAQCLGGGGVSQIPFSYTPCLRVAVSMCCPPSQSMGVK